MNHYVKIGVISDIHANASALAAALAMLEREGVNEVVVMGDLLTYGCHVVETLDLLLTLAASRPTTFLIGNHDLLYMELQAGQPGYYDKLPPWIKESARWTCDALGDRRLASLFDWKDERVISSVLFCHANPFGARDWTYLSNEPALAQAAAVIARRGLRAGVFGHTHRAMASAVDGTWIFNPGSVGQPRDARGRSSAASLGLEALSFSRFDIDYDEREHRDEIGRSTLSDATKNEILKYHATKSSKGTG